MSDTVRIPTYLIDDAKAVRETLLKGRLDDATYIINACKRLVDELVEYATPPAPSKKRQAIAATRHAGLKYPWKIDGYWNCGGVTVGDLFTDETFEILAEGWREAGIEVKTKEVE